MDYFNWFLNIEPALHTWDISYLILLYYLLIYLLFDSFYNFVSSFWNFLKDMFRYIWP